MKASAARPWFPVPVDEVQAAAIKAMARGTATEGQQIAALQFIVNQVAATNDLSYRPDELGGSHDTAFAEGRRFVGLQLRKIVETPTAMLLGQPKVTNERPSRRR